MKHFTLLLLVFAVYNLYSQPDIFVPTVEDYQLKGHENKNFTNVLLDPSSLITDFYCITDNGEVLKVENMGDDPDVTTIFTYEGKITEAITYDSTHYLSLSNETETLFIGTKDFISLDTLYQESGYQITDFRIYDNTFYLLMNNGVDGKIAYRGYDITTWSENSVPDIEFNRLAVKNNQILLFKYLVDRSFYRSLNAGESWNEVDFLFPDQKKIADIKILDTLFYTFGRAEDSGNRIDAYNDSLLHVKGAFGPVRPNTILDVGFYFNFNIFKNDENCQVGFSEKDIHGKGEGALFNKYISQGGDGFRKTYDYSSSLNKIKSNERSRNMEFVAVGNDGIILIINRGATPVLGEVTPDKENNSFLVYPNLVKGNSTVYIKSNKIIDKIELINLTGSKIFTKTGISQFEQYLELQDLNSGMYFIKINGEVQKLLVE